MKPAHYLFQAVIALAALALLVPFILYWTIQKEVS